jgi:hypothetical protein
MDLNPEIKSMSIVHDALKDLTDEEKARVVEWAIGKFSIGVSQKKQINRTIDDVTAPVTNGGSLSVFGSVADLFAKANLKSEADRVLVAAAYLQEVKGASDLTGREINKELHNLGHAVGNITNAVSSLIDRKPQLMIQTRKDGKTQQAKKKYKVTVEGFSAVKKLIAYPVEAVAQ